MLIESRVSIRYADCDPNGHINNAVYSTFLEAGRVEFVAGPMAPAIPNGALTVLAHITIDYRREGHYPGMAIIGTRLTRLGRSSFDFWQAVNVDGVMLVEATSTCVLIDAVIRRALPFAAEARGTIERMIG
jgi:acyl-CoA thioester hydrolase